MTSLSGERPFLPCACQALRPGPLMFTLTEIPATPWHLPGQGLLPLFGSWCSALLSGLQIVTVSGHCWLSCHHMLTQIMRRHGGLEAAVRLQAGCRDAGCIASLTRQFSTLASGLKTPSSQIQDGLERSESLEMHTMSSAELRRRHALAPLLHPCQSAHAWEGGLLASVEEH